jgi:hypothetical protein
MALKDGGVMTWGFGHGDAVVPGPAWSGVTAIAAGQEFSLVLKGGAVIGWALMNFVGQWFYIPEEAGAGVTAISAAEYRALAVKDGRVLSWDWRSWRLLDVPLEAQSGVVAVSCGHSHSLALKSDGSVVAWGSNTNGQTTVPAAALSGVVAVAAGYEHSWALKSDGTLIGWGYGVPAIPTGAHHLVAITSTFDSSHTMAIRARVWATLNQAEIIAGGAGAGTVTLPEGAGPGGLTVNLGSNSASVHLPATVTVPEGQSTANFVFTTDSRLGAPVDVSITASVGGSATVPAILRLKGSPFVVTLSRPSVIGGSTVKLTGAIVLNQPASSRWTVFLSSSDVSASVPPALLIPAGASSAAFTVTHDLVAATHPVTIEGFAQSPIGGSTQWWGTSRSLSVLPVGGSVLFDLPSITSGGTVWGFLYLNVPLRSTVSVPLSSTLPANVSLPVALTMPAGSRMGFFPISTSPIGVKKSVKITGSVGGSPLSGNLVLLPVPWVSTVTQPIVMNGNCRVTGTVKLLSPAPFGGATVNLAAGAGLSVPASVTIAEGQTSVTFQATAADVSVNTPVTVIASNALSSASCVTTIKPIVPTALTLPVTRVSGGELVIGTVTLSGTVAVDTIVSVSASNTRASVQATTTVRAGSRTGTFLIITQPFVGTSTSVVIQVTKNGKTCAFRLNIVP